MLLLCVVIVNTRVLCIVIVSYLLGHTFGEDARHDVHRVPVGGQLYHVRFELRGRQTARVAEERVEVEPVPLKEGMYKPRLELFELSLRYKFNLTYRLMFDLR